MQNPLISVIIPAYNIEAYIEKSIACLQNQTYQNLQIIIVDDGSSDRTGAIIDDIAAGDPRVFPVHQENGGVTRARLTGLKYASGAYIGFMDGDDYIEPDMYQRLLDNALAYEADISHCGYQMVFPGRKDYYYNTGRVLQQDHHEGIYDLLKGDFIEPGLWNKLYKADLVHSFLDENGMDLDIRINEDLLMNFLLFQKAERSIYEDFCPYHYMVREGSAATSRITRRKLTDPLKVMYRIYPHVSGDPDLKTIIYERTADILINMATADKGSHMASESADASLELKVLSAKARKKLWSMLPELFRLSSSRRIKVLSLLAALNPSFYRWLHSRYAHIRGTDTKYAVQ